MVAQFIQLTPSDSVKLESLAIWSWRDIRLKIRGILVGLSPNCEKLSFIGSVGRKTISGA